MKISEVVSIRDDGYREPVIFAVYYSKIYQHSQSLSRCSKKLSTDTNYAIKQDTLPRLFPLQDILLENAENLSVFSVFSSCTLFFHRDFESIIMGITQLAKYYTLPRMSRNKKKRHNITKTSEN